MPTSLIRILCFSSLLLILGCTPAMFRKLPEAGSNDYSPRYIQAFPDSLPESLIYKTVLQFRENEFNSLTYLSSTGDSVFHIALLTAFGNTILEADMTKDKFNVRNCIPELNRKYILNFIEKDWRLLLSGNLESPEENPQMMADSARRISIFVFRKGTTHRLYDYKKSKQILEAIELYKGKKRKTRIHFSSVSGGTPGGIWMEHPSLRFSMEMTLLKKAENESDE